MPINVSKLCVVLLFFLSPFCKKSTNAQNVTPEFYVLKKDGEEKGTSYSGSAPIDVRFEANPEDLDEHNPNYEWYFYAEGETKPYLIRYGETTEYTFKKSGTHKITLHAKYIDGDLEVDKNNEETPLTITISESQLDFPNSFSPNDDGKNDKFKAKKGAQSIIELNAAIYNRWGQMVFKFKDINDEWDGTYKGQPVKEGVYFLNCDAKGADGRHIRIRKDINLLRSFTESRINK